MKRKIKFYEIKEEDLLLGFGFKIKTKFYGFVFMCKPLWKNFMPILIISNDK